MDQVNFIMYPTEFKGMGVALDADHIVQYMSLNGKKPVFVAC